jgi:hypothetical protein
MPGGQAYAGQPSERGAFFVFIVILELLAAFFLLVSVGGYMWLGPYYGNLGFVNIFLMLLHLYLVYIIWNFKAESLNWGGIPAYLWIQIINLVGILLELFVFYWYYTIPAFIVIIFFSQGDAKRRFS